MNYETITNDELEIKLGELLGMGTLASLIAPRYCTEWSATMPLAVEHGVCVRKTLRAIVICIIKVLEAKQ